MGDRNNPIKFGPEWLRNMSREHTTREANNQNSNSGGGGSRAGSVLVGPGGTGASAASAVSTGSTGGMNSSVVNAGFGTQSASTLNQTNTSNGMPKIQLAKLRYGREEMLALYDPAGAEAPVELKYFETLYQARGKSPLALHNTFDEDMPRENTRGGTSTSGMSSGFNQGRGTSRVMNVSDSRGRTQRMPFVRPTTGSKRQGSTNWRSSSREENDEWRSGDSARARPGTSAQEKWERDWNDRPSRDRSQPRNSHHRSWGGDSQNEENLPEWAVGSAEACAGTFDSSGAFHGYSNDDSNLPKNQENPYTLARSHTHGTIARTKSSEETASDEWWASEKAKKLSPKKFDASEIKFKKPPSTLPETDKEQEESEDPSGSNQSNTGAIPKRPLKRDSSSNEKSDKQKKETPPPEETNEDNNGKVDNASKPKFAESKTFDTLMRSDILISENSDEGSKFQSVMIAPNNSLRQKHQNIVTSSSELQSQQQNQSIEPSKMQAPGNKMVEELLEMTLEEREFHRKLAAAVNGMNNPSNSPGMQQVNSMPQMPGMVLHMPGPGGMPNLGMNINNPNMPQASGLPAQHLANPGIDPMAMNMRIRMQAMVNQGMNNDLPQGMNLSAMQTAMNSNRLPGMPISNLQNTGGSGVLPGFPTSNFDPRMIRPNIPENALFATLRQNINNNPQMQPPNDIRMNNNTQGNMFPMHGLRQPPQQAFTSMYNNLMQQNPNQIDANTNSAEQWYYEDPKKNIQGPFSSKEMDNWYRAGFFSPSLMVRRACDPHMRPLGSYGPIVPFAQMPPFLMPDSRTPAPHETMLNSQPTQGLDVMGSSSLDELESLGPLGALRFNSVGMMRNPPYDINQSVDSLWSQSNNDMSWMHPPINNRAENNLQNFFWDLPASITSTSLLPEEIAKEMKTEDQILAQLRATQNINQPQTMTFLNESVVSPVNTEESPKVNTSGIPNLEDLQKLIQNSATSQQQDNNKNQEVQVEPEVITAKTEVEPKSVEAKEDSQETPKPLVEPNNTKAAKQAKNEAEKAKTKEATTTKTKKKGKDEKKEELVEPKIKEDNSIKTESKKSEESSPAKTKKEEKAIKKELEKDKKDWIKVGLPVAKSSEKAASKDNKKKAEENKAAEEAERKRKEEEKQVAEEEKKKKQAEAQKKQQETQRQAAESVTKKAPWSSVATQGMQSNDRDGLTLAEIQRLEREKKLEQMKEQQQMMQLIAQQQAAAMARENEIQAGLGWASKPSLPDKGFAEIQAETRKQAAAAAVAAEARKVSPPVVEEQVPPPVTVTAAPWANTNNGAAGFWEMPSNQAPKEKNPEPPKPVVEPPKTKKKPTVNVSTKKEPTPQAEFENWCTNVLVSWSSKIDVPTFVLFLKDIESPYEVKDYVKCYLGETKESSDFARQFLEKRSKLLRLSISAPSDDLCSPAVAVNPRTNSGSDYTEVKGKGKKTKKNKMLKVDARILGFSVTAAEDRINVGDIDSV